MDNILICGSCGARMRIQPATLKVAHAIKCSNCHGSIPVSDELRQAAIDGSLQVTAATVKKSPPESQSQGMTTDEAPPVGSIKPKAPAPSKRIHKPIVISKKKKKRRDPISLDAPDNSGVPLRPKTIVAPPPASAPVTVSLPAAHVEGQPATLSNANSHATVQLAPSPQGNQTGSDQQANKAAPVRLAPVATQRGHRNVAPPPASPTPLVTTAAPQSGASGSASAGVVAEGGDSIMQKVVADLAALEMRVAELEAAGLIERLAALEKASNSSSTIQKESSGELAELVERFNTLKTTVSGIDNRLACMLKACIEYSQSMAVEFSGL